MLEKLPCAASLGLPLIGSIAGHSIGDFVEVAEAFADAPNMPLVEINVSCPNTADGLQFGETAESLERLLREVRPALKSKGMIVKLPPSTSGIVGLARIAIECGADALTISNTVPAMAIDVRTRQPRLSRGMGGLSGPAIHHIVVRLIHLVHEGVAADRGIPIIGLGGVMNWRDAAEFILAGSSAVGIGTGLFVDPGIPRKVARGLESWVRSQEESSLAALVGKAEA